MTKFLTGTVWIAFTCQFSFSIFNSTSLQLMVLVQLDLYLTALLQDSQMWLHMMPSSAGWLSLGFSSRPQLFDVPCFLCLSLFPVQVLCHDTKLWRRCCLSFFFWSVLCGCSCAAADDIAAPFPFMWTRHPG